ncbi:DNA-3-methyladenine glycosylase I [Hoyosella sp. G463]|uniref:DNA-3-methyladenine glycosylase I n=1 Tax=Lolliginicoccus lacisalsi TaxID=2742202 RepID=A0A927JAN2_9ACTN|nr:DNA-3-methyladenine glycosylase I [Lolliginicoccus lacisalsi]MBD8505606.1 DNA-3-methyladenine glycosylase I [Lolliginicoccus lacisalsi]
MTRPSDLVIGADGLARPPWAASDALLRDYYDTEWGMPVTTERGVLERLCLEGFQAGLSWATILRKRPAFRDAFAGFEPEALAGFGERDADRLMGDARIVRNRRKIEATITNARATLALRDDPVLRALATRSVRAPVLERGLPVLVWSFQPSRTPAPRALAEIPTTSPESVALSRELKRRGFRFVGPTTMHALMEAIGVIDTHLVGSHRRGSSGVWG